MMSVLLPILLVAANVLGAGMIVPQVVRLHRTNRTEGLSPAWIGLGVAMNLWWIIYAAEARLWGILPVSSVALGLYLVIVHQLVGIEGTRIVRGLAIGALGLGLVPLPFLLVGGWSAAGLAIGLTYGAQFAPATWAALRSPDIDGISPTTWSMALAEAAIWFVYGLSLGDVALVVGGGGGGVMAAIIVVRLAERSMTRGDRTLRPL